VSTKTAGAYFTSQWFGDDWIKAIIAAEREALVENATNIVRSAQQNVTQNKSIATGAGRRSIGMNKPHEEGGVQMIDIGLRGSAESVPYMFFVEHGRKAGKRPPIAAILPWVLLKHLDSGGLNTGVATSKRARVGRADREKIARSIAFLIARAIGKHGIKPRPFMKPAYDMHAPNTRKIFTRRLADKLRAIGAGKLPL